MMMMMMMMMMRMMMMMMMMMMKQQHYNLARQNSKNKAEPPHRPHVSNAAHACTLKYTHCDA
jgi:hypothetical protein